jgi:hypothetical protein
MPIQLNDNPHEPFVILRVRGKLTLADCLGLRPRLEECLQRRRVLRLLLDMEEPHAWKLGAVWESARFELSHYTQIERIAILGGSGRERLMARIHWFLTAATIRCFPRQRREQACRWLAWEFPFEAPTRRGA